MKDILFKVDKRKIICGGIGGLGMGFCFIAGKCLDVNYTLDFTDIHFYLKWLLMSVFCMAILLVTWMWIDMRFTVEKGTSGYFEKAAALIEKAENVLRLPGILFALILCWIPVWLSLFPGAFSYDAYDEWMQICTGNLTAHHPVLHVLFLGGLVEGFYQLFGDYNLGIAVSTFLQMVVLAGTFSYTIGFMRERDVHPLLRLFAFLFYGFSPVVGLFSISSTKDTLFAAAFLLFLISVYRLAVQGEKFFANRKWRVLFILSAIFTMIMRNNGLYVVLCTLAVGFWAGRKYKKKYLLLCVTILAVYGLYVGPFYNVLDVTPGGKAEMLSVPLQQLARVYHYEKDTFSTEQLEYLYDIVPEENWEMYRSTVSDYVKVGFRQEVFEQDPGRFFRVWLEVGWEHPLTYVNSFLLGTVDFWYPFAVVDGYQDVYGKSSFFDFQVSEPGTEMVLFPTLHVFLEDISWDKEAQKLPGIFLLLSPGWYLLVFLSLLLYQWKCKRYDMLLVLLPILVNFGTVLLGPIALVRYVLILFFAFPMYCTML